MQFAVDLTTSAEQDLRYFSAFEQRVIVDGMKSFLATDAHVEGNRRKQLRPNDLAPWELRIGDFRVFYQVELSEHETERPGDLSKVLVTAIGRKEHNDLLIRGTKAEL